MNLLYVTHRVPYPPDKGDRIRTYHTLRELASRANVYLAALADEPLPTDANEVLDALCVRKIIAPIGRTRWIRAAASFASGRSLSEGLFHSSELTRTIQAWSRDIAFDACLASSSGVAHYLPKDVTKVVDLVDVDSQKWLDYAAATTGPKAWLYRREGIRLRRAERRIAATASAVTLVSDHETKLFRQFAPEGNVVTVTNGVDLDAFTPMDRPTISHSCVFVGALDYVPNIDAACWFVREVWPRVLEKQPQATVKLVGRKPVPAVLALSDVPGVEVVGQVPDVRPYVAEAEVAIAPLRIARGLQNKVLEAMAMGKPIIASGPARAGFAQDVPAVVAESPEDWANTLTELFNDPARRATLGDAGRAYAEARHDWADCLAPLADLLRLEPVGASA